MTYRGEVQNGVVVFQSPPPIPDGTTVDVTVIPKPLPGEPEATLYDLLRPVIGVVDDMPADSSANIDHYLYGHPKK